MTNQILAIASCRVSSDEQLKNNSLNRQRDNVIAAAGRLGAVFAEGGWWSGSVSSKRGNNINRKDIREMLEFCSKNKAVKYLIIDEPDRFMRSIEEAMYYEMQFKLLGVKIWYACDDDLNSDNLTAKLMKFMKYFVAEGSNEERQRKSISGQTKALMDGRYTFVPKPGYKKGLEAGIHIVDPVKVPALQKVLRDVSYRRVTPTQGLIELNKSDFMRDGHSLYKMDKFRKIATDAYYAGVIEINKQVQVRNEEGLHEPLICLNEHLMIVDIFMNKRKNQKGPRKNGNPLFPVSNKVVCKLCADVKTGRYVGLELHNGKNTGKIYEKYRCRSCKRYISKEELHQSIEEQFSTNPISEKGRDEVLNALEVVWKREAKQLLQNKARIEHSIKAIKTTISNRALAAIDPANSMIKDEILSEIEKNKQELVDYEKSLRDLSVTEASDKREFMEFAYDFIENMGSNFLDPTIVSSENRERCKQIVFPAGFWVNEDNKVYTPEISELYRLATIEKDAEASDNSLMVRVKRL